MISTSVPVQVLVTAGRFRDNRRGGLTVEITALEMCEIVLTQPGIGDTPHTTTRIVLAGEHLNATVTQLRLLADVMESANTPAVAGAA